MKELTLTQQYALLALDGLESLHPSMAKNAVFRAIAASKILENYLNTAEEEDWKRNTKGLASAIEASVAQAKSLKKKEEKELEAELSELLEADGLLEQIPDILGCDMDYVTAGVKLKAYRSEGNTYMRIKESLRADILEDGEISIESALILWLLRESGCIHDLFSSEEQSRLQSRMLAFANENEIYRMLWETEFHNAAESFVGKFLKAKQNLFKNPYLEGINLLFPYIERRKAIFIDFVILGTDVKERRIAVMEYLMEKGHYVEEVSVGSETLLKIDNAYYRIFPMVKRTYKFPIQGANLVPVYW